MGPRGASMLTSIGLGFNFNTRWNQDLGQERKSLNNAYDQQAVVPRRTYFELMCKYIKLPLWCSRCSVPFNPGSHCLTHKVHDSIPQWRRCRGFTTYVQSQQSQQSQAPTECCRTSSLKRSPWRLPHQR